jgi:chromate transporter
VGFGGPIALAGHMQQDLVDSRGWIRKDDYLEGLALAQLAPGPLAAQLAIYLGYIRAGVLGATAVGAAFVLPSFLMVLALSAAYVRFGGLPWMQGMFYGIGAAVIGIIARSAFKLTKLTLGKDKLLWAIFAVLAVSTAWTSQEIIWLFVLGGVTNLFAKAFPSPVPARSSLSLLFTPKALAIGVATRTLLQIFVYFAKAGMFVFGSGLAVVPFLYGGVVQGHHWLTDHQFVDAVAVAMITPGPVVITVAFIGYLVAGIAGATAAALGIFLPVYLVVVLLAPTYKRWAKNPQLNAFVRGVTAAATGAIAGAVVVLARRSVYDLPTILICVLSLAVLFRCKVPEPVLIACAALAGLILWHA